MMRRAIQFMIIAGAMACFPTLSFSQQPSKKEDARDTLQTLLEQQRVVPFTTLTKLRYAVLLIIDDKKDPGSWLKPEITVPLKALGIEMVEQVGENVDIRLPVFAVAVAVSRTSNGRRSLLVRTSIQRWVSLVETSSVKFMTSIWGKDESTTVETLESVNFAVKSIVNRHISEIVRYWAQANAQRINPSKK
ncbi:MAG: hypothetical protein ABI977_17555 [Acidobacteriota bacterium]